MYNRTNIVIPAIALLFFASCASIQPAKERITVDLRGAKLAAGTADAQFDKILLRGLQKQDITVVYYPGDDVICLQFRINMLTHYQYWSRTNRAAFVEALDKYKADYEQRKLKSKSAKAKRAYGTLRGYFMWETSQFTQLYTSYPEYELGYYFHDQSPYFAVTMREAPNEDSTTREYFPYSAETVIYFTRAQADQIALMFDPDYIRILDSLPSSPTVSPAEKEQAAYVEK